MASAFDIPNNMCICQPTVLTVSGNVWHDVDGLSVDNSGPLEKDALPEPLFVYLTTFGGVVTAKTLVANNAYSLAALPNTDYSVILTTEDLPINYVGLFASILPSYWEHTVAENVTDNGLFGGGIASAIMLDASQIVNFGVRVIPGGLAKNVFYLDITTDVTNLEEYYNGLGVSLVTIKEDIEKAITLDIVAIPNTDLIVNISLRHLRLGVENSDEITVNCGIDGVDIANIWIKLNNYFLANSLKSIHLEGSNYEIDDYANQTYIVIQA